MAPKPTALCPHCHRGLRRSTGGGGVSSGLPVGLAVLFCPGCSLFAIETVDVWIAPGPDLHARLTELAKQAPAILAISQRKLEIEQFRQDLIKKDPSDPKWWPA